MKKIPFPFLVFVLLAAFQLWLLKSLTLFITPEFTVYTYFSTHGLLPYRQIIDQHFPAIFFGPFGLETLGLGSPQTLLLLYPILIILINLLFWRIIQSKTQDLMSRILLQLGLIFSLTLLAVNHLWLETFTLVFVLAAIFLLGTKKTLAGIFAGFFLGLAALTRPLLGPFLFLIWWRSRHKTLLIVGGLIPLLVTLLWLIANGLMADLVAMLGFNGQVYAKEAVQFINRGAALKLLWVGGWLGLTIAKPTWSLLLAIPAALLPSYPRFELFHNLLLVSLSAFPQVEIRVHPLAKLWLLLGLVLVVRQTAIEPDVNFYYPEELYRNADVINKYNAEEIYFFGGPDQLYYLTNTLPPDGYYLPSLPWYHSQTEWVDRQTEILVNNPDALVVVNPQSRVGGKDLLHYSQRLYLFVTQNYQLLEETGPLQIWSRTRSLTSPL